MIKVKFKGRKNVVCARVGGANTTSNMAAHFAKQNTKFGSSGKRGRAKIPSPQPPSFLPARAFRFCARSAQSFGVLLKKYSNFVQKTPPSFTFSEIERCCLGAKRLGMVFFRNFEGIFEIQNQSAVGNAEVRRAKLWQNEILQTNLFSFVRQRADEMLSAFFFDCPKANYQTIWTT
ncbi:MAG: hypothetical protein PHR64_03435 [Candidatus Shapirobacteria bacterium]|nr:hypothetical protein [Candidatus Shapirobacteria bacterium]